VAKLKARFDAGQWKETRQNAPILVAEARKIAYQPLVAEALLLSGHGMARPGDSAAAEQAFNEAFLTAEASRHDEVRAEAAAILVYVVGYQQGRFQEGRRWAKLADAILQR